MRTRIVAMLVLVLGVAGLGFGSPVGMYVQDDFTTATVNSAEWTTGGGDGSSVVGGTSGGSTLTMNGGAQYVYLASKDQVSPGAGQTVMAKAYGLDIGSTETWSYELWGLSGGDDAIVLVRNKTNYSLKFIIKKNGVEQVKWMGNEYYGINGNDEITWTPGRITLSINESVRFDTATDGGSWDIPTDPMGLYSEAGFNSNLLYFGAQGLEVVPEPGILLLMGAGVVGLIRRRRRMED